MKWKRTANGYECHTKVGHYEINRPGPGNVWTLYVEGEEYKTAGLAAALKNVAEHLNGDRQRRVGKPLVDLL